MVCVSLTLCLNFFFHFSAAFWLYGKRVINLLSKKFDRLLCECATGMIQVRVPTFTFFSEKYRL